MSEEVLRLTREMYDAWNRGDLSWILDRVTDDFEFITHGGAIPGMPQTMRGPDDLRRFYDDWFSGPWVGHLQVEVEELVDLGDSRVLAFTTLRGKGEGSGVDVEMRYAHLATIRDGKWARIDGYADWGRARQAAGL